MRCRIGASDTRLHSKTHHRQLENARQSRPQCSVAQCVDPRGRTTERNARAFFSEIAQGASAKTEWRSMRAEQVSIAQRWRRPRSELIRRARRDAVQAAEKRSGS